MTDSLPVVLTVVTHDQSAVFEFEDGHRAVFDGYSHGWGYQIEGLSRFTLHRGDAQVARYNARLYRSGPREDEHRFVQVAEGYTAERIASYWRTAKKHVNEEFFEKPFNENRKGPDILWLAWRITSEGWMDLERIERGTVPLPEPTIA